MSNGSEQGARASVADLSGVSDEALVEELLKRTGLVCSIWNSEDVRSFIEDDEATKDFTEEQINAACAEFLCRVSDELQGHLGDQGNFKLGLWWEINGADVLKAAAAPAPQM